MSGSAKHVELTSKTVSSLPKKPGNPPEPVPFPSCVVLLFPVRYALGWNLSRTPHVDGSRIVDAISAGVAGAGAGARGPTPVPGEETSPFKVTECDDSGNDGKAMPLKKTIHYTLRSLRYGYLYAYYEVEGKKIWQIFDRNWFELRPRKRVVGDTVASINTLDSAPPDRVQAGSMGMLVVLGEDPIWFGFSDHLMSDASRKESEDSVKIRNCHMRKFDPKAWQATKKAPHVSVLKDVDKWVADFAPGVKGDAFAFSQDKFQQTAFKNVIGGLKDPSMLENGAILALEDPVGITSDLAWLMMHRYRAFMNDPAYSKQSTTIIAIGALENSIRQTAREDAASKIYAQQWESVAHKAIWWNSKDDFEKTRKEVERDPLPQDLEQAADAAWSEFTPLYRVKDLHEWQQKAEKQKQDFIRDHIDPLANLHVTWMDSHRLHHVLNHQYHERDKSEDFMDVFGRCVSNTQGWKPCRQSYTDWLKDGAGAHNPKNLVLRALACNDSDILDKVKEAQKTPLELDKLALDGWVSALSAFDKAAKDKSKTDGKRLANLISEFMGPLTERMSESFDRGVGDHVCALLTASGGGRRMLGAKLELPALDAARYIDDHIWSTNPGMGLAQRMKATEVQLIRAGIWDPKTGYTEKVGGKWYILERPGEPFKVSASGELSHAVIESEAGLKALAQEKWQRVASSEVRWGLVAGIFQGYNLNKLIRNYHSATGGDKAAAGFQLTMGCAGMACTMADLTGKVVKNLYDRRVYMGSTFGSQSTKYLGEVIEKWAARVSIGLAVVAATPDVMKGVEEWNQGYIGRSVATEASAATGVGAVVFVAWECPLVGAVCLVAFVAANIFLAITKKQKLVEWLRRSSFGVGSENNPPYTTMEQELDALSFAFETDVKNAIVAQ